MLGEQPAGGRRRAHAGPEDETVIGRLGQEGGQALGAVEQARLQAGAEVRAVAQGRIAEGCGEQGVEPLGSRREQGLDALQHSLQEGLLAEIVHQSAGRDLLPAFDDP